MGSTRGRGAGRSPRRLARIAPVAAIALVGAARASGPAPLDLPEGSTPARSHGASAYILEPIASSAIGISVNMPVIRGANGGWDRFAEIVRVARAGGYYLMLNNMDGPRGEHHVAATFDHWTHAELITFASVLAGSGVPVMMYVGPVEDEHTFFAVGADRLLSWRDDVAWLRSLTGARAGLAIDASAFDFPGYAPGGQSFYAYFSLYAQVMAAYGIEVGFEAFVNDGGTPREDRRHYALLQYVMTRYSALPETADADARIMSAVDSVAQAANPRRNTVWLDNAAWAELADGDHIPAAWLNLWGVTPGQLQSAVAARLWAKGFGLIMPPAAFGID